MRDAAAKVGKWLTDPVTAAIVVGLLIALFSFGAEKNRSDCCRVAARVVFFG